MRGIAYLFLSVVVSLSSAIKIFTKESIRFDWKLEHDCGYSEDRKSQRAFRLKIFHNNVAVHDTGIVESNQTSYTTSPNPIPSNQLYEYKIQTYFGKKCRSETEKKKFLYRPAFSTNKTKPIWNKDQSRYAMFKSPDISLESTTTHIHVLVTAYPSGPQEKLLGAYRLYVNGNVVGLGPGRGEHATNMPDRPVMFDIYDLTNIINTSQTLKIGIQCYHSDGKDQARVMAEIVKLDRDGSNVTISTNSSWLAFSADHIFRPSSISQAQQYDAPLENIDGSAYSAIRDWTILKMNDWSHAVEKTSFPALMPKTTTPITFEQGLAPVKLVRVQSNRFFIDFGEELMGGIRLEIHDGIEKNFTLQLKLSEEIVNETSILFPMRTGNRYESMWIGNGSSSSYLMEHHEYMEFRYGELKIIDETEFPFQNFSLTAWRVRYKWDETEKAQFVSSSAMLNKVYELCENTLRITSLDTMTDSNTRERLPYEADGYITDYDTYSKSPQNRYEWFRHSAKASFENPTWPTEWRQYTPLIAYEDYMRTGSLELFNEYEAFLSKSSQRNCIDDTSHLVNFTNCRRSCFNDTSQCRDIIDWPQDTRDGYVFSNVSTVINAFAIAGLRAMAVMAKRSGYVNRTYDEEASKLEESMRNVLWSSQNGTFFDGEERTHTAWHAQTFPLWVGNIVNDTRYMFEFLKSKGMIGSVYGAFGFLMGLYNADYDRGHFALEMLTSCNPNASWCHMINVGATATMEAWTRAQKPNLSWSHPWATAPITAIVRGLMGIRALEPKYTHFKFKPQIGSLEFADLTIPTLSGSIRAVVSGDSTIATNATLYFHLGTRATICMPVRNQSDALYIDGVKTSGWYEYSGGYTCVSDIWGKGISVGRTIWA